MLGYLEGALKALSSIRWKQLETVAPAVLRLLEVKNLSEDRDDEDDEDADAMQCAVVKPVGNALSGNSSAYLPAVLGFFNNMAQHAETAQNRSTLRCWVFQVVSMGVLTEEGVCCPGLGSAATLLLQLGFEFGCVSARCASLLQESDLDSNSSDDEHADPWAGAHLEESEDEVTAEDLDAGVTELELLVALSVVACDEQAADQFFGTCLWSKAHLLFVCCTLAGNAEATTMDEGTRVAATQLVCAAASRVPDHSIRDLSHCSKWIATGKLLVDAVSTAPSASFFCKAQDSFFRFITCFDDDMKLRLIKFLLRKTTQQPKVVVLAALMRSIKAKRAWEDKSPLLSLACLEMLSKEVRNEAVGATWIVDASEVLVSLLGIFKFCLMKDKFTGHQSGMWEFVENGSLVEKVVVPVQRFLREKSQENVSDEGKLDEVSHQLDSGLLEEMKERQAETVSRDELACMRVEHAVAQLKDFFDAEVAEE
eukprot:TRINITY_DN2883_c0_g1_i12.p1 TRINITY_DN2883_c0_g1~~TRINITY_DN2883_c0_g1_i12.p1  ORF type:complete len:481 (-),score=132.58 TRINITY_DN2883_c0_g1_i12:123-1565(-)